MSLRKERLWGGREQPGKSWGESKLQQSVAVDKLSEGQSRQLFTWCLVLAANKPSALE